MCSRWFWARSILSRNVKCFRNCQHASKCSKRFSQKIFPWACPLCGRLHHWNDVVSMILQWQPPTHFSTLHTLFHHFLWQKKNGSSAMFEPCLNLNLVVLQVWFTVLPLLSLMFSSGSKFRQIPWRTRPNWNLASLIMVMCKAWAQAIWAPLSVDISLQQGLDYWAWAKPLSLAYWM